jgi:hypothetical protein
MFKQNNQMALSPVNTVDAVPFPGDPPGKF